MSEVESRPAQKHPHWGVMFHDGSVRSQFNGKTALRRNLDLLEALRAEYPNDQIDLAYRPNKESEWTRLVEMG